jgi:hypothetical protein
MQILNDHPERYIEALGRAALEIWSDLPQEIQQLLFEQAARCRHSGMGDESLREQLAKFLHDNHERTPE